MLVETLSEVETEKLNDTLVDVEAKTLLATLADKLTDVEPETLSDTVGDVEASALNDTLADKLVEVEARFTQWAMFEFTLKFKLMFKLMFKLNFTQWRCGSRRTDGPTV